jgi:hypothetical protein
MPEAVIVTFSPLAGSDAAGDPVDPDGAAPDGAAPDGAADGWANSSAQQAGNGVAPGAGL